MTVLQIPHQQMFLFVCIWLCWSQLSSLLNPAEDLHCNIKCINKHTHTRNDSRRKHPCVWFLYLFPGLIAASVWIPPPMVTPVWLKMSRLRPLMTPTVRVWSKPNGFPIAKHCCPTLREFDCPTLIGLRSVSGASTFKTARSLARSAPTSFPSKFFCTLQDLHNIWAQVRNNKRDG